MNDTKPYLLKILCIALLCGFFFTPQVHAADEVLCYTEVITGQPSFNIYTGKDHPNNPIIWSHNVPAGILDSVVRVGLYIEAWDVDHPEDDEHDRVLFNGQDLGLLAGANDTWFTVEKTVPVTAIKEGINNLEVHIDELGKGWKVTIRKSELRFYCSAASPDFSIGATPPSLEITQGEPTFTTVELTGLNGFNSAVTLNVTGLPAEANATFVENPLTPAPTASTQLDITTTGTTPVGTYTLVITGTSGETVHDTEVTLKVNAKAPEPDFTLTTTTPTKTVTAGNNGIYSFTVTPQNDFSDNVNLAVTGLPSGVTAEFAPNPISTGNSQMTVTTTAAAAVGTHTLTVTGTSGDLNRDVEVELIIQAKAPDPDFTLNGTPASQTINAGDATSFTFTITPQNGFDGDVTLTSSTLPSGVNASFDTNPLTVASQSKFNITTTAAAAVGTHTITVTGTSGTLNHEKQITLIIRAKPEDPDFTLNATPPNRTIDAGESTHYNLTVKPLNGFTDDVTLSIAGLPGGTSASFTPNPLPITGQAKLNVITTSVSPAGVHTLTITGKAGGKEHSVMVTLEINEPLPLDFTINASPITGTILAGETVEYIITLKGINGYRGKTFLTIDGLPTGATAEFAPDAFRPDGDSKLTVTTTAETPVGEYTLTVMGKRRELEHTVDITLKVQEEPPEPDFEISIAPGSRSLYQGDTAEYTVTLTPLNDFAEPVDLTISGVPTGTSSSFGETTITPAGSTNLKLLTSADTPNGTHTITVTAKGGGLQHSSAVTLTVNCRDFSIDMTHSESNGAAPLTVNFNVQATGTALDVSKLHYAWNFGDGSTSAEQSTSHTFQTVGVFNAAVTVTGPCGIKKTASATIEVEGFEGQISKSFSVTEASPGDELFITIEAGNQTKTEFENIIIRDQLSPLLQYISDDAPVSVNRSGQKLEWSFPRLKKGEVLSYKIKVKVVDSAPAGAVTNIAYLSHQSLGAGKEIASNTASFMVQTIEATLRKQVEETTVEPGKTVKYQLTLSNKSSVDLTQVKITDELSSHLEYLNQTNNAKLKLSKQGQTLTWSGDLGAKQTAVIILRARVKATTFAGTRIENSARLEASRLDKPVDSETVVTTVVSDPVPTGKVRFSKRAEVPQTEVGRIVRFRLTLVNNSSGTLVSPVIEDHLPQGFSYVAGTTLLNNQKFTDPQGKRRLLWQLPHVGPGDSYIIRYQVVIGADTKRGRNVNRAVMRAVDTTGKILNLEASAFVNVSGTGLIFYSGIEGTVYLDRDNDEFYSMTDTPLEGIEVRMSTGQKAVTDRMGRYKFENLFPGEYAVGLNRATLPERFRAGSPVPKVAVLSDGLTDTLDFAVEFSGEPEEKPAKLQGRVFFDKNLNKTYDGIDTLCKGFSVKLKKGSHQGDAALSGETLSTRGSNGIFKFNHLKPGVYTIRVKYAHKTIYKEVTLKQGKNIIEIPMLFTGITVKITGEDK